jgi:hypothetical protein
MIHPRLLWAASVALVHSECPISLLGGKGVARSGPADYHVRAQMLIISSQC